MFVCLNVENQKETLNIDIGRAGTRWFWHLASINPKILLLFFFMYFSQKIASRHLKKNHHPPPSPFPVLTRVLLLLRQHYRNLSVRHWIQVVFWQRVLVWLTVDVSLAISEPSQRLLGYIYWCRLKPRPTKQPSSPESCGLKPHVHRTQSLRRTIRA